MILYLSSFLPDTTTNQILSKVSAAAALNSFWFDSIANGWINRWVFCHTRWLWLVMLRNQISGGRGQREIVRLNTKSDELFIFALAFKQSIYLTRRPCWFMGINRELKAFSICEFNPTDSVQEFISAHIGIILFFSQPFPPFRYPPIDN